MKEKYIKTVYKEYIDIVDNPDDLISMLELIGEISTEEDLRPPSREDIASIFGE